MKQEKNNASENLWKRILIASHVITYSTAYKEDNTGDDFNISFCLRSDPIYYGHVNGITVEMFNKINYH